VSGSLHYYRLPSKELWAHRLERMKGIGLDAVDLYFFWGYHSPAAGVYDFTGPRDVDALLDMIEDRGFYLIARPGPYICSEVTGGGLPAWLLAMDGLNLRCRKRGEFSYDQKYMGFVKEWYEQIVPRIARRENLILFQVENEYHLMKPPSGASLALFRFVHSRFGPNFWFNLQMRKPVKRLLMRRRRKARQAAGFLRSSPYLSELCRMAKELGVKVPITHNDAESWPARFTDPDIPSVNKYPVKTFDYNWGDRDHCFSSLDEAEEDHSALGMDCPLVFAEAQGGWFDMWGGRGYGAVRRRLGPANMDVTLKSCLAQGPGVINVYPAVGGTNWGYIGSPDVHSSYDFAAPVSEGGRPTGRSNALKAFIGFVRRHEEDLIESVPGPPLCEPSPHLFCRARHAPSGKRFLFFRNLGSQARYARVSGKAVNFSPVTMSVIVTDEWGEPIDRLDPVTQDVDHVFPGRELPELNPWSFAKADRPVFPDYDDSGWIKVPQGEPLDLGSLGLYHGYAWYRGRIRRPGRIRLDARHCWAAYLNGNYLYSFDNLRFPLSVLDDMAQKANVSLPAGYMEDGENVLVILVESLGFNKGFQEDLHLPRGIVSVEGGGDVEWRVRGGLLPGEEGLTPLVDMDACDLYDEMEVTVPHRWPEDMTGIGLYRTRFSLDLPGPDDPPIGLHVPRGAEKMNIYLNGSLVGRYWESRGPQRLFYLPAGILKWKGENELCIAAWRWDDPVTLGRVHLEMHP